MQKILDFWSSVPDAQHLRILLLIAEAGVGKSRLLEEALQAIHLERGAVVHVKLYPEAANSLAALVARSLWTSRSGQAILHSPPGENMGEIISGLQRISRLRPTLLVLEDVHLFPSESIPDLVRLFEALVDETISVLCLSRPATIAAQGILERYLVESVTMKGLSRSALISLWKGLFESPPPKGAIECLHSATKGNPLAVRSGLRGAIQTNSIVRNGSSGVWEFAQSVNHFQQSLQRSVSLVVEGMVAHLSKEHRSAAEALATLGEVFAREAALVFGPDVEDALSDLMGEGIIVETFHPVSPLCGVPLTETGKGWRVAYPASDTPLLAFTHSLLHDYLANRAKQNVPVLLRLISEDAPLYSLLPLRLLETARIAPDADLDLLVLVVRRIAAIAQMLDRTANWKDGADLLGVLNHLVDHLDAREDMEPNARLQWRMHLHHVSLSILRRSMHSPEWVAIHERQLVITQNPPTRLAAQYRVLAHSYTLDRVEFDKTYEEGLAAFGDVTQMLEQYPDIASDISYIYVLESLFQHGYARGDMNSLRLVQQHTEALFAAPDLREEARQAAIRRLLPNLLKFFETPEELRDREESIELIEQFQTETDPYYGTSKTHFFGLIGRFQEALLLTELVMRRAKEQGLVMNYFVGQNWKIVCGVGTGDYTLPQIAEETRVLLDVLASEKEGPQVAVNAAAALLVAGFLSGKVDEAIEGMKTLGVQQTDFFPAFQIIVDFWHGRVEKLRDSTGLPIERNRVYFSQRVLETWQQIARLKSSDDEPVPEEIVARLVELLREPILQIYDVLTGQGTVKLWKAITDKPMPDQLVAQLTERAVLGLEWLQQRNIYAYMEPLCRMLEEFGKPDEGAEWRKKIKTKEPAPVRQPTEKKDEEQSLRVSMSGTIRVAVPPEDYAPIRGVRIRTLLGLMVADRMIASPLSAEEFLAIAGGKESDPEHARKKKNMAVVRLREIIGHDAILTDGPTPQLNLNLVSVDLLELDALIQRTLEAVRQGAFVRALPLIEEALDIYNGDVPFPSLYEDFFEAVRGDFEYRLRRTVLELGKGMLAMGDGTGVEPILRKAFALLPGDEEIADILGEVFEASGNRIEAERIRMKVQG